ncbi:uncharacterized protein LOC110713072 [Chenopodium quinoa]|uniref:uncharacterized protein LOC110713072 n=1 Tax=Chenopodium quinoa TaxID=63459 RepID=UPI000B780421|nr:uncharacterized protein LOC110713072 [Chenopodium quinoa]
MAELWLDEEEEVQDAGIWEYESETESMDDSQEEEQQQPHTQKLRKQLTMHNRRKIVDALLVKTNNGTLPRGHMKHLSSEFNVHKSTITRIFTEIKRQLAKGDLIDVRTKKIGRTGRKPLQISDEILQSVPLHLRQTERSYVGALKISHSTVHNLKKRGRLRAHTCCNKPALTSDHKIARLRWILSHINPVTGNEDPTFVDMRNVIHCDEKWFYLNPNKRRFYLLPTKEDPYIAVQSKRFKLKAMFMAIIGKPLYDINGELLHDGKYGIFPFTVQQVAQKSSKNRAKGTLETKALQNINREVIRKMLLTKVIPSIISKWPESLAKDVVIQWDNARPHQVPRDAEFMAATTENGFNIQFVFQPAQSPDLNVLDLGLFRSIQSLQYQSFPRDLDELVQKVRDSYDTFNPQVNKYIWVTLQQCMMKILKAEGGNKYRIPHMNKKKLENIGILPEIVEVQEEVVMEAVDYLNTMFRLANQAHEGHDHADGPMPMMKHGGPGGDTPNSRDDMGGSSSLAPFSALMVGLVAFVFSIARI